MTDARRPGGEAGKALLVGGGARDAERVADMLAPDAQVICLAPGRMAGDAVRAAILTRRPGARVAVMVGEPGLLVHKVAGPFDVILDAHAGSASRHERLRALLAEGGELYG